MAGDGVTTKRWTIWWATAAAGIIFLLPKQLVLVNQGLFFKVFQVVHLELRFRAFLVFIFVDSFAQSLGFEVLSALLEGIEFAQHGPLYNDAWFFEQLLVAVKELNLHSVNVSDIEVEHFGFSGCYYCELSGDLVPPRDPLLWVKLVLFDAADYIDEAKMISSLDVDVLCIVELWYHKACISLGQKAHVSNFISFQKDVLLLTESEGLQERTDPGDKRQWLVLKEPDIVVFLLVDPKRDLHLHLMGQLVN